MLKNIFFSPYVLKVIPREKISTDYFIITATGVNHVYSVTGATKRDKLPEQAAEYY